MSDSTLLDVANVTLRAIGERPVLTLNTVQGDRVKDAILNAARDVEALHTWDWLYKTVPASAWVNEIADIGTYQRLFTVSMGDTIEGYRELVYVPEYILDQQPIKPYTGDRDLARFYTLLSGKVRFSNYPADSVSQSRIKFYIQQSIVVPTNETDTFSNVPEKYITLLTKKASHLMAIRYLDDAQLASYFQQELEQLVQQYRNVERKAPVRRTTMYKGGK